MEAVGVRLKEADIQDAEQRARRAGKNRTEYLRGIIETHLGNLREAERQAKLGSQPGEITHVPKKKGFFRNLFGG